MVHQHAAGEKKNILIFLHNKKNIFFQLAFDSMLKMTKVELSLMSDESMILFIEVRNLKEEKSTVCSLFFLLLTQANIRGGLSYIGQRYCEEKKTSKGWTKIKLFDGEKKYIALIFSFLKCYLFPAINLYGRAMMYKQPTSDYDWVPQNKIPTPSQILKMTEDQEIGYFFDADIYYPPELHRKHSSYPVAPYNATISFDMLSPYAQECHEILNGKVTYKAKKLCTTFRTRRHYGIHYLNAKTLLQLGLKIIKIHRCLAFRQTGFLQVYIESVTSLRQKEDTDFGKSLFKLFANR